MPRAYHSPSSIDLGRRCEYAWALCYIAKLREPDVDYRDIESKRIKAWARALAVKHESQYLEAVLQAVNAVTK